MAINKIVFSGNVLIDLTEDTVTPEALAEGVTAYAADGTLITGTNSGLSASGEAGTVNPGNNIIVYGGETLVDLSTVTVTPETLLEGYTAHMANGAKIVGIAVEDSGLSLSELPLGSIVMINESGTPKPFYLATHNYEPELNGSGRTLMVRERSYPEGVDTFTVWHSGADGTGEGNSHSWNKNYAVSNLDRVLTEYKNVFSAAMQAAIGSTTFYYTHMTTKQTASGNANIVPDNNPYVTTLSRSVFQLSVTELFGEDFVANGNNQAYCNVEGSMLPIAETLRTLYSPGSNGQEVQSQILTRSPATYYNTMAVWGVNTKPKAFTMGTSKFARARPSFTLPATTPVNPEPNADGSYTLLV